MKTVIKKCMAFMLATGIMISSITVQASGYTYTTVNDTDSLFGSGDDHNYNSTSTDLSAGGYRVTGDGSHDNYYGIEPPSTANPGDWFYHYVNESGTYKYTGDYYYDGNYWIREAGGYIWSNNTDDSENSEDSEKNDPADAAAQAEAMANHKAAREAGFITTVDMYRAAERNMSACEYYNNIAINTPGIENSIPVGQGGGLVVDGEITNMTATINKVERSYVDSVRNMTEGTVLNVVNVQFPAREATINFYMPGIADDAEIIALQYVNGTWTDVEVTEIRADHVVLNLKQSGNVAFIQK